MLVAPHVYSCSDLVEDGRETIGILEEDVTLEYCEF